MTDREMLVKAKTLLNWCTLVDKSGQCQELVNEIDEHIKNN